VVELWVNQGRDPGTLRLNVNSGIAGCRAMVERITGLADEYGPAVVKGVMRRVIADCSRVVGERLRRIPDGSWSQRLYVSGALGEDHRLHQEVLTLTKRGEQIVCGNAGTSPQGGPGNSTYSVLRSAVVAALASAVGWDQQGCMAGIADHVVMEPVFGTRSCANPPAATSALHSVFVTMNLAGLTTGAMLMSGPPDLAARTTASGGLSVAMADIGFGLNEDMSLVAPPVSLHGGLLGGGVGAFPHRDGMDNGGSWFMLGTSAGNIEPVEQEGVGLVLYRRELRDGGGPGRWRGGNGTEAAWIPHHAFMSNAQMVFVEPSANLAAGLAGGYYALAGNFMRSTGGLVARAMAEGRVPGDRKQLEEETGALERLHPQAVLMPVPPGDAVVVEHNGGGGFGDPLGREPERVADDVAHGRVSVGAARKFWGVVLDADGAVDSASTETARQGIRRRRLESAVAPSRPAPRPEGPLEIVLPGAGGSVDLVGVGDAFGWACAGCGHWLAESGAPFQDGAAVAEHAPHDVDARLYPDPAEYGDASLVLRQYHCPSCAGLLGQQFCRREDGPGSTLHLELATLRQRGR
ncbi:MAG TPA: hydantoinase B/oxoprolinase family protein, partial [Streptomyces sp.]|uniref:hydantoinase B/oxoprolinase family protein n=1 Tax=Streptomyces sp. TaxID=1931 RepID=UPI002B7C9B4E